MTEAIRVGTRRSLLARTQTDLILRALKASAPARQFETIPIATQGDRDQRSTVDLDFTDAIDQALEADEIDLAVHSAKDLPVTLVRPVEIVAFPRRADPRDALVLAGAESLAALPPGARIGSSSLRRRAQLLRSRPDLEVVELRGNVDSRVARVRAGELDGAILAVAGLERLGRADEISEVLPTRRFLPSPGQGALAVVARRRDRAARALAGLLDHRPTRAAVTAERSLAAALGGDCTVPLGVLGTIRRGQLTLSAEVLAPDGRRSLRGSVAGAPGHAAELGARLGDLLLTRGARELLARGGRN